MTNFYIKEIKVCGSKKTDAIIRFDKGLNIISGPSNTGKTKVFQSIDFIYGKKEAPFSKEVGYDVVKMAIVSNSNDFNLERKFESNTIIVTKLDKANRIINRHEYNTNKNSINNISNFFLRLIDVKEPHQIIKNSNYKTQKLTWRTIIHSLMISEKRIGTGDSILWPKSNMARTAYYSALNFLLTGNDLSEYGEQESLEHKKVRKRSVTDYINENFNSVVDQYEQVKIELDSIDSTGFQDSITTMFDELDIFEKKLKMLYPKIRY